MVFMSTTAYTNIRNSLCQIYLEDNRPWLVGFSGGKDSTMLASLIFDAVFSIPVPQRKKPVTILCTDTRVEIPAISEMVETVLARMHRFSRQNGLCESTARPLGRSDPAFGSTPGGKFYPRSDDGRT
jgi:DNA sulfur modification protein DndC